MSEKWGIYKVIFNPPDFFSLLICAVKKKNYIAKWTAPFLFAQLNSIRLVIQELGKCFCDFTEFRWEHFQVKVNTAALSE